MTAFDFDDGNTSDALDGDDLIILPTDQAAADAAGFDTGAPFSAGSGDDTVIGGDLGDSINAGDGADSVSGNNGDDLILGEGGNDQLSGDAGDDTVVGGNGDDLVDGGTGDDLISGDAGNDTLAGGDGDDTLDGGADNDQLSGGAGADSISAGSGDDSVDAGDDNDVVDAGDGDDIVVAGAGDDTVVAGPGDDSVAGGDGDDLVDGGEGNDQLSGDLGDDTLFGGAGDDALDGGEGNDLIDAGTGNDVVDAGAGDDSVSAGDGNDAVLGGDGNDTIAAGDGADDVDGGTGDDLISGDAGNDTLAGGDGDDTLDGGADNDQLSGGAGADSISAGDGDDLVDGGEGNDQLSGDLGDDTLFGGAGDDALDGGEGNDLIDAGTGNDVVDAGAGDDSVSAGDGNDAVLGGDGNDTLFGDDGDDTLLGGAGDDEFFGGTGDDSINGGAGSDNVTFTGNADEYDVTFNDDGTVTIVDTVPGHDGTTTLEDVETATFADETFFTDGTNNAPEAFDETAITDEDTAVSIDVLSNDTDFDSDPLTVASANAANGSVTIETDGTITYVGDADFNGTDTITYTVDDGRGGTDVGEVSVTVNAVNDAPVITVPSGGALRFDGNAANHVQVAHDPDLSGSSWTVEAWVTTTDADNQFNRVVTKPVGGSQTYSLVVRNGEAHIRFDDPSIGQQFVQAGFVADGQPHHIAGVFDNAGNRLSLYVDGQLTGSIATSATPSQGTEELNIGRFNDGFGQSFRGDVSEVRVWSAPRSAAEIAASFDQVLDSANEPDLALYMTFDPTFADPGKVQDLSGHDFDGTIFGSLQTVPGSAPVDQAIQTEVGQGVRFFGGAVADADAAEGANQIQVTVESVNGTIDVSSGTGAAISGDQSKSITITGTPAQVSASLANMTFTPDAGFVGTETITITADDLGNSGTGVALTDVQTFTIQVVEPNVAPEAADDVATVDEDGSILIDALANDVDDNGDALTITAITVPANGSAVIEGNQIRYTPDADFNGTDTINYTVTDGKGEFDTAQVTVTVNAVNDAPVATDDTATTDEDTAVSIDVLTNDSDIDGDALTVTSAIANNGTVVIETDGSLTYTPDADFSGTDTISYTTSDGELTDTADVSVTVHAVADAPIIEASTIVTAGEEILVNTTQAGDQDHPAVAALADGGYVVVWDQGAGSVTESGRDVLFQRFDASGQPVGSETEVTTSDGTNWLVTVEGRQDGGFIVAWTAEQASDILVQIYDANGLPAGGQFIANTTTANEQRVPAVEELPDGSFVVAWRNKINSSDTEVRLQKFAADGTMIGGEILVNESGQRAGSPDMAVLQNGNLLISYLVLDAGNVDIAAKILDQDGNTVVSEFRVHSPSSGSQVNNAVSALPDGGFVATWASDDGDDFGIFMQRFDSTGTAIGTESLINDTVGGEQNFPNVVSLPDGRILVTWTQTDTASGGDVFGRLVDADGTPLSEEFLLNTTIPGEQSSRTGDFVADKLAVLNDGRVVSVWQSSTNDSEADSIIARVFSLSGSELDTVAFEDQAIRLPLNVELSDTDGSEILDDIVISGVPTGASLSAGIDLGNGNWRLEKADLDELDLVPAANFNGEISLVVTATSRETSNGSLATSSESFTISVDAVNDAPVADDDTATTDEDTVVSIDVLTNDSDIDGDALTVTSASAANGTVVIETDGSLTYTPDADFNGSDTISYVISDGDLTDTADVAVTVNAVNDAPVASDDTATTDEDTAVSIDVLGNDSDVDGDALTVTVANAANGSVVIESDGSLTYTPDADFNGADTITYTISDGDLADTAEVAVTVNPINDAPEIDAGGSELSSDLTVGFTRAQTLDASDLLANYVNPFRSAVVIDEGALDVLHVSARPGSGFDRTVLVEIPLFSVGELDADARVTINIDGLIQRVGGDQDILFGVRDTDQHLSFFSSDGGTGLLLADVLTGNGPFGIASPDNPPLTDRTVPSGSQVEDFTLRIDLDGDADRITLVEGNGAAINVAGDPGLYIDAQDAVSIIIGSDQFHEVYEIVSLGFSAEVDGLVDSGSITFTDVDLGDTHSATVTGVSTTGDTNGIATATLAGFLTLGAVTASTAGSTGSVGWTFEADDDLFAYLASGDSLQIAYTIEINDNAGGTDSETVTVTINGRNDGPVAADDIATTDEDTAVSIDVLANDSDVDGDALTVISATANNGSVVIEANGSLTYTPDPDFFGSDTISYVVSDGELTDTAQVAVTVNSVNDSPEATDDTATTDEDTAVSIDVLANDSDTEGEALTVTAASAANGSVVIETDGSLTYTPDADFNGSDTISYTISDGDLTDAAEVAVTVNAVNDAPQIALPSAGSQITLGFSQASGLGATNNNFLRNDVSIAALPGGGFAAIDQNATGSGTRISLYDANGGLTGSFLASETADSAQDPTQDLVALDNGTIAAMWVEGRNDVRVRIFESDGTPVTGELEVKPGGANSTDGNAAIAAPPDGGFVVAYRDGLDLMTNRFDADGNQILGPLRVGPSSNVPGTLDVTATASGGYAVTYIAFPSDGTGTNVRLSIVDAAGTLVAEDVIGDRNSDGNSLLDFTAGIAELSNGNLVVVWEENNLPNRENFFRIFDASGNPVTGDELVVNWSNGQVDTEVMALPDGGFVVSFTSEGPATDLDSGATFSRGSFVQRFDASGARVGEPVFVADSQAPDMDLTSDGNIAVVSRSVLGGELVVSELSVPEDPFTTDEDTPIVLTGFSISDVDAGEGTGEVTAVLSVTNGTINVTDSGATITGDGSASVTVTGALADVNAAIGSFDYSPTAEFNGTDSLQIDVSDLGNTGAGGVITSSASVTLTVNAVNDAPVAVDDAATIDEDSLVNIDVLGNDSDVEGDALTVTAASADNGSVVIETDGSLTYTPDADFNGSDTISYVISDGELTDTAQVAVTVNAVNDAPSIVLPEFAPDLFDDFEDGTIDQGLWSVQPTGLPGETSTIVEGNGVLTFTNRAHLVSVDDFIPTQSEPLSVTGSFRFNSAADGGDQFQLLTRSNGEISNHRGETELGLQFRVFDVIDQIDIRTRTGDNNAGEGLVSAATGFPIVTGVTYEFSVLDDGFNVLFTLTQSDDPTRTITIGTQSTLDTGFNKVVVHNREFSAGDHIMELDELEIVHGAPEELTTNINAKLAIGGISVFDTEAAAGEQVIEVVLSVNNGTLEILDTEALTVGDGTNSVTINGSLANVNAAISSIEYTPDLDFAGSDQLTVSAEDNAGAFDSAVLVLDIGQSNQAPILSFRTSSLDVSPIDLSDLASTNGGFAIVGESPSDGTGRSVSAAGDVNGDGIDDVIVGAPLDDPGGSQSGSAYVVFGKSDSTTIDLAQVDAGIGGFAINGSNSGDYSGRSVSSVGDMNGDGFDDIIVGADRYDAAGERSGSAFVIFGKADGTSIDLEDVTSGVGGFAIRGAGFNERAGFSVSGAGDVNGDGIGDAIVGIRFDSPNGTYSGGAMVVFGKNDTSPVILNDIKSGIGGFIIEGVSAGDQAGQSVSGAGDVNGDGLDDIIVGAYQDDPNGGGSGASFVVFGKSDGAAVSLSAIQSGTGGFVVNGTSSGDQSGFRVADAGDVNGDGLADLLIGARGADENGADSGAAYVVFGKPTGSAIELSDVENGIGGFFIKGAAASDRLGYSVDSIDDINGDGIRDILVGAPEFGSSTPTTGSAYIVFGRTDGAVVNVQDIVAGLGGGLAINGIETDAMSGFAASRAGDLNGDGVDDVIIGAPSLSSTGESGAAYVVFSPIEFTDETNFGNVDPFSVSEDEVLVIKGLTASDSDIGVATIQVAVSVGNGTLDLADSGALVVGNGSGSVTLSGTLTDVNASIGNITYTPDADFNGTDTLLINLDDGNGGTDTAQVSITVNPVADRQTVSGPVDAGTASDTDAPVTIDLLANAFDADGDDLDVQGVTVTSSNAGRTVAFTVDQETGELVVDPTQFGDLLDGQNETLTIDYAVSDDSTDFTDSIGSPNVPNGGVTYVIDFDDNSTFTFVRSSGPFVPVAQEPVNGAYLHLNPNNGFGGTVTVRTFLDGVETTRDASELTFGNYGGTLNGGGFSGAFSNSTIDWTAHDLDTADGERCVSIRLEGISHFTDDGLTVNSANFVVTTDVAAQATLEVMGVTSLVFTDGNDTVDLNNIVAADADDGNVSNAGDGRDIVTLADNATEAAEAGFVVGQTFFGGAGEDNIFGGGLDDVIDGGDDNDIILSGSGNDTIFAGDGNNLVHGETGDDSIVGGSDRDSFFGEEGNDTISGGAGRDTLRGGDGDDLLSGDINEDDLFGGNGNDTLFGGDGFDELFGDAGNDQISGGDRDDILSGGAGDDTLDGGVTISGDQGDTADYTDDVGGVVADLSSLSATDGFGGTDQLLNIEHIQGSAFNDTLTGDNGANVLSGSGGDDTISGNGGRDTLSGGDDNDSLSGGAKADDLSGGDGNDTLFGDEGFDELSGDAGDDLIDGGTEPDTINGGHGNDTLIGGDDDDVFIFSTGDGADQVFDFTAGAGTEDVLDFSGDASITSTADLTFGDDGAGNATVGYGASDLITLIGVVPGTLDSDDFQF